MGALSAAFLATLATLSLLAWVLLIIFVALLSRIETFELNSGANPASVKATYYLLVGSDGAIDRPEGDIQEVPSDDPNRVRADVVVVVRVAASGSSKAVVIPREVMLPSSAHKAPKRLTLELLKGPDAVADSLCVGLGIPTDHMMVLDAAGLRNVVDALGGVTADFKHPVRDPQALLDIPHAGVVQLDGEQALALVRSRHPETFIDGKWELMGELDGIKKRSESTSLVYSQLAAALKDASPVQVWNAAWSVADNLRMSQHTSFGDLLALRGVKAEIQTLDVVAVPELIGSLPTAEGFDYLRKNNFSVDDCGQRNGDD